MNSDEVINEPEPEEEEVDEKPSKQQSPVNSSIYDKTEARRERRRRNRRAKQDAKRILDALTNLINSNEPSSSDDDTQIRAPPLIERPNYNPQQLSFHRRRLAF